MPAIPSSRRPCRRRRSPCCTFLTAVRSDDLRLALRLRVASACRARLRAWAVLAMDLDSLLCWRSLGKKTGHNSDFSRFAQGKTLPALLSRVVRCRDPSRRPVSSWPRPPRARARRPAMNLLRTLSTVSAHDAAVAHHRPRAREPQGRRRSAPALQMDAFEAAFRLPNILRRLFAEGAFSQAFVPILAEYQRAARRRRDARPGRHASARCSR